MATKRLPDLSVVAPNTTALAERTDEFLHARRAGGAASRTLEAYRFPLERVLLPFCELHGIDRPDQLTQKSLDLLSSQLLDSERSRATVATYIRHINLFVNWLRSQGETSVAKMQRPRVPRKVLDILSEAEIDAMENQAPTERDKVIIRLLADTGIRMGELLALTPQDLNASGRNHYLRVLGKGGDQRLVPIPRLYPRLKRFIERSRPTDALSERVFLSLRRGSDGFHAPLTKRGVEQMIAITGEKAAIGKRVYPHLFRHSFATMCLRRGMSPLQLMQILGHSSLDMITHVYSHLAPTDAYDAMTRVLIRDS